MTHQNPPEHFKGKSVSAHLKDARKRGAIVSSEMHGEGLSGFLLALANCAQDVVLFLLLVWAAGTAFQVQTLTLLLSLISIGIGAILWKAGRAALQGWARLEKLHRVIEEERWEIQHHPEQEREELREMYEVKGFSGKLLDEVVEVLMADDNRLLQVMLEEELGLSLEIYEHPLKHALGAGLGALIPVILLCLFTFFWPFLGAPIAAFIILVFSSSTIARYEKRSRLTSAIWTLSLGFFSSACVYFLTKLFAS